jgi:hypothetical protein
MNKLVVLVQAAMIACVMFSAPAGAQQPAVPSLADYPTGVWNDRTCGSRTGEETYVLQSAGGVCIGAAFRLPGDAAAVLRVRDLRPSDTRAVAFIALGDIAAGRFTVFGMRADTWIVGSVGSGGLVVHRSGPRPAKLAESDHLRIEVRGSHVRFTMNLDVLYSSGHNWDAPQVALGVHGAGLMQAYPLQALALDALAGGPELVLRDVPPHQVRLIDAVAMGDADAVGSMLDNGVMQANAPFTLNMVDTRLLMLAPDARTAALLLSSGADVRASDAIGRSVLHRVVQRAYSRRRGAPDVVRLLIERGADVNGAEPRLDQTALFYAANDTAMLRLLLGLGARADVMSWGGSTPLHTAYWTPAAVRLLLDAGAPIDAVDDRGRGCTALAGAARSAQLESVEVLLARGASVDAAGSPECIPVSAAQSARRRYLEGTGEARGFSEEYRREQVARFDQIIALLEKAARRR